LNQEFAREYRMNRNLQVSRTQRLPGVARARRITRGLSIAALAVAAWGCFYPHPYDLVLVVCVLLPWAGVAVVALRGGPYRIETSRNDPGAHLSTVIYLPGGVLLIRSLFDVSLIDWPQLLWMTLAGTAGVVALIAWLVPEKRDKLGSLAAIGFLMLAYAWGTLSFANNRLDRSRPVKFKAQVVDKFETTGRGASRYLTLSAWGPRKEPGDVNVSSAYYARTNKGATVCVYLWPGALGVRRFDVGDCGVE